MKKTSKSLAVSFALALGIVAALTCFGQSTGSKKDTPKAADTPTQYATPQPNVVTIAKETQQWKDIDYLLSRRLLFQNEVSKLQTQVADQDAALNKEHEQLLERLCKENNLDPKNYTLDEGAKTLNHIAPPPPPKDAKK